MVETLRALVLLVDDSEANRYAVRRMLQRAGYEVREAATGEEALEAARQRPLPDLVVLDVKLPDTTGYDVCRTLKAGAETSLIPVLQISASFVRPEDQASGLDSGAAGYLTQPVDERLFISTVQNLLRTRRAEEALRESRELLQAVIEGSRTVVFAKDLDARYFFTNRAWHELTGIPLGEADGLTDEEVFGSAYARSLRENDQKVIQSGKPQEFEEHVLLDDRKITYLSSKSPLRDASGEIYAVCGVSADVTEMKRAESLIRDAEERLRLAGEAAGVGFWRWDLATSAADLDGPCRRLLGLEGEAELKIDDVLATLHRDDAAQVDAAARRAITEASPFDVECRVVLQDGTIRWLGARGNVIRCDAGKAVQLAGVTWDITAQKAAETERAHLLEAERAARSEAELANRMKDEFLATVSHELRTPLNAILGWAQILRPLAEKDPTFGEGVAVIERNARVQAELIEDLLDMSRIISGRVRLDDEEVDLREVVRAAVESIRPLAQAKGIALTLRNDDAGPVRGDTSRLQQVVWNLLSNAIKFTPEGGVVGVSLERKDDILRVVVTDSGVGIPADFLPYVFDRFRQSDPVTKRRNGGLGLGLAIVKQLVELHSGCVRAESEGEGRGATFIVELPLAVPSSRSGGEDLHPNDASTAAIHESARLPELSGLTVLAVDDEPDSLSVIQHVLERRRARVLSAASAEQALPILLRERPHVLISDIGMSGLDGYELIRKVRSLGQSRGGEVPAIALTAFARAEDERRALRAGYQIHLPKPIDPNELVQVVAKLAGRAEQAQSEELGEQ